MPQVDKPIDSKIIDELSNKFVDFRRALNEDGLKSDEFDSFGPTRRTLRQFIAGCGNLGDIIRDFMLPEWGRQNNLTQSRFRPSSRDAGL